MDKLRDAEQLTIDRLPHGGFVVSGSAKFGELRRQLFASLQIGEALQFIENAMQTGAEPAEDLGAEQDEDPYKRAVAGRTGRL